MDTNRQKLEDSKTFLTKKLNEPLTPPEHKHYGKRLRIIVALLKRGEIK